MTQFRFPIIPLIFVFTVIFAACNGFKAGNKVPSDEEILPADIVELRDDQIQLAHVELGSAEMKTLSNTLKVNGIVSVPPQSRATVCLPVGGYVKSTTLMPGNRVSKGQTLAIIESQDFVDLQQKYLETKYRYDYAKAEYERHSELYKDEVYSEKNFQAVATDYKSLRAELRALEQKLSLTGIDPAEMNEENLTRSIAVVAPISGFVKTVNLNTGKYVGPTEMMFEIENSDNLFLELTLFEKDAIGVAPGQKIRFFINNETEQHNAVIYQTGKSIGADKTIKVYATVQNPCENILPGMYVNALIEEPGKEAMTLPSEAIVTFDDKDYIFVFEKEKDENGNAMTEYRMIEIKKGMTDSGYTEVILPEGLNIQDARIVTRGAYTLLSAKKNAGEMAC